MTGPGRGGWRVRLLTLWLPLGVSLVFRAVPVLLDGDHLAEIEPGALQPQGHAADRASPDAEALCRPDHRDQFPAVDLETPS